MDAIRNRKVYCQNCLQEIGMFLEGVFYKTDDIEVTSEGVYPKNTLYTLTCNQCCCNTQIIE